MVQSRRFLGAGQRPGPLPGPHRKPQLGDETMLRVLAFVFLTTMAAAPPALATPTLEWNDL